MRRRGDLYPVGRLLQEAESELKPFVEADGRVAFDMPALILTARNAAAS